MCKKCESYDAAISAAINGFAPEEAAALRLIAHSADGQATVMEDGSEAAVDVWPMRDKATGRVVPAFVLRRLRDGVEEVATLAVLVLADEAEAGRYESAVDAADFGLAVDEPTDVSL